MLSRQNGTGVEASVPFFMLIFLAESKTMSAVQREFTSDEFSHNCPVFESEADKIMDYFSCLEVSEIADLLGISTTLAAKAKKLAYDFPHKATGTKSLEAFIGDAYHGLDVETMPPDAIERAKNSLRIISSVYGLLKPSDIIKPYRCEFNKGIDPQGKTASLIFKPKITVATVNLLKTQKRGDIIDLLPGDADKCLDWKIIRAYANVHKVVFQTIDSEGKLKTPIAKRLKEVRGIMAREILLNGIETFKELINLESMHYIFSEKDSKPGLPVFIV